MSVTLTDNHDFVTEQRARVGLQMSHYDYWKRDGPRPERTSLSGTVRIGGQTVGTVNLHTDEDDPNATRYVSYSPAEFGVGTYDLTVDGEEIGTFVQVEAGQHETSDVGKSEGFYSATGESAEQDALDRQQAEAQELADSPGYVDDGDGGAELAPAVKDRLAESGYLDQSSQSNSLTTKGALAAVLILAGAAYYYNQ